MDTVGIVYYMRVWEGRCVILICYEMSTFYPLYNEQLTQNWSGQGESDCLIKTKHCDGLNRC